jgi:hypothetical protein
LLSLRYITAAHTGSLAAILVAVSVLLVPYTIAGAVVTVDGVKEYRYHRGGLTGGRIPYETELLALLLRESEAEFGPARIVFDDEIMSNYRARERMRDGKDLHIQTGVALEFGKESDVLVVEQPILKSLLGYRQLIVKNDSVERITKERNLESFVQLMVGQVTTWADAGLLEKNGILVRRAASYSSLYPMLKHRRFDYISLGVGEVHASLAAQENVKNDLCVIDDLVLYYPWPAYITVSKSVPELAKRFDFAMEKIKKSGQFDEIFYRHFHDVVARLNKPKTRVYILKGVGHPNTENLQSPVLLDKAEWIR